MTKLYFNFRLFVTPCLMLAVALGLYGHLAAQVANPPPSPPPAKEEGLGQNRSEAEIARQDVSKPSGNARTTSGASILPAANLASPVAVDPNSRLAAQAANPPPSRPLVKEEGLGQNARTTGGTGILPDANTGSSSPQPAQAPPPADPADDIRGPKPLIEIPQPQKPPIALWSGIGGGLLALALAAWWWWYNARRCQLKSPAAVALAALEELEKSRESMAAEALANRAAQTVRQYIADRFGLAAPLRTTEEFLHDLAREESLSGEGDHLRVFLKACDLAKFAAAKLDPTQRADLVQGARAFVTATAVSNSKSKAATP